MGGFVIGAPRATEIKGSRKGAKAQRTQKKASFVESGDRLLEQSRQKCEVGPDASSAIGLAVGWSFRVPRVIREQNGRAGPFVRDGDVTSRWINQTVNREALIGHCWG